MRTFEFIDSKSKKFWNIELQGDSFSVVYGRIGTSGRTQTKKYANAAKALAEHDKLVKEKTGKGYVETTMGAAPAMPTRQVLENALCADPDDLGAHAAYADLLIEQGDPRGEFIQVQLALEDEKMLAKARKQLLKRENELLRQHERQWLGDAGRFLVGAWSGPDKPYHYQFARGWLDLVRILPCPDAVVAALARSPQALLLRLYEVDLE